MSTSERVKALVDQRFLGNVNAAAKAWAVPQPTLRRIVAGLSERPRADVLARIAKANDTSVEWLLTGEGTAPKEDPKRPLIGSVQEWRRLVENLVTTAKPVAGRVRQDWGLTEKQERMLIQSYLDDLPFAMYHAAGFISPNEPVHMASKDSDKPIHLIPRQALDASARFYIRIFEAAIAEFGEDMVMARLRFFLPELIFGFGRGGLLSRSQIFGLQMTGAKPPLMNWTGEVKTGKALLQHLAELAEEDVEMNEWIRKNERRRERSKKTK